MYQINLIIFTSIFSVLWIVPSFEANILPPQLQPTINTTLHDRSLVRKEIFTNYDKNMIPDNVTVQLGFDLIHFDADPDTNRLDMHAWLTFVWADSRLTWNKNPGKIHNVDVLHININEIWKPDIVLYNSFEPNQHLQCAPNHALVKKNGEIFWITPCTFKVLCNMEDLRNDPDGKQSCFLNFGSWSFNGFMIDLKLYNDKYEIDQTHFWDVSEWNINENNATLITKYYECCQEPYPSIQFNIEFERKIEEVVSSSSHTTTIIQTPIRVIIYIHLEILIFRILNISYS